MNSVIIPFKMEIIPITKLALINFDNDPEDIYKSLELQYLATENEGSGYRVIAYRNDRYVDVYDDENLQIKDVGAFEVCYKGLANYKKVLFSKISFKKESNGMQIEFALVDIKGRLIDVTIKENSRKSSEACDLIAPIGVSAMNPIMLPVYAMYNFDFIRKRNTEINILINGRSIKPDSFPVPIPKDGQLRYFCRYGYDCELVDFGRAGDEKLKLLQINNNGEVNSEGLISSFQFENNMFNLKSIRFEKSKHKFIINFIQGFPDIIRMDNGVQKGDFNIEMDDSMGHIDGEYTVSKQGEEVEIKLIPTNGWSSKATMLLTKIMFNKKSVFRTWPKTYEYTQTINLETRQSDIVWRRINFTPKEKYI